MVCKLLIQNKNRSGIHATVLVRQEACVVSTLSKTEQVLRDLWVSPFKPNIIHL